MTWLDPEDDVLLNDVSFKVFLKDGAIRNQLHQVIVNLREPGEHVCCKHVGYKCILRCKGHQHEEDGDICLSNFYFLTTDSQSLSFFSNLRSMSTVPACSSLLVLFFAFFLNSGDI